MKLRERAMRLPRSGRQRTSTGVVRNQVQKHSIETVAQGPTVRHSVYGRPRALTRAQIARVLAWHDSRVTFKELAANLNVSTSTLRHVIKSRGSHYKQAPPEERAEALIAHRVHVRGLQAANWL
jgi:hypothetical protein